jgi:hypothetical protein
MIGLALNMYNPSEEKRRCLRPLVAGIASEISAANLRDSRKRTVPPLWRIGEERSKMDVQQHTPKGRAHIEQALQADFVVVGGGLAGVCCAITAAREGVDVILVQDRPVLGGNASSEVRMWVVGATSHMGNNNRWAREGGVIDEILVENLWRNPGGNPVVLDGLLLEKVVEEPRITLLLDTTAEAVTMNGNHIGSIQAYCSQSQILYRIAAPLYCDASGDGILGYLSGAGFRMGSEGRAEFLEALADEKPGTTLLGHSLFFYARDTGKAVRYVPPSFARMNVSPLLKYRELKLRDYGQRLWWLEYGGALDTVHDTQKIKWELWSLAYGIWNHIKNSGQYPEASTLVLEWMGMIPGKRESRRFEGDVMLCQQDIVEQRAHPDAVSYGGWAIDLHPPEGVYSPGPACTQWHAKGIYQIPFRTMYSRDVPNLFLAGRLISVTHIAFGSIRVMATCAHNGQAVGMAAAICKEQGVLPRELAMQSRISTLQQRLLRAGQYIPGVANEDSSDLAQMAEISASSTLVLAQMPANGGMLSVDHDCAMLLPLQAGPFPVFSVTAEGTANTTLTAELWKSSKPGNFTPEIQLGTTTVAVCAEKVTTPVLQFEGELTVPAYVFLIFRCNPHVKIRQTQSRVPGVLALHHTMNAAVTKSVVQTPPANSGIDCFGFWLPQRRPAGVEIALGIDPPLRAFETSQVINGIARPVDAVNGWVPAPEDNSPRLCFTWPLPQKIQTIQFTFDTDFDHPMETVLMAHPETAMPSCVRHFKITDGEGRLLAEVEENRHTLWRLDLPKPICTKAIAMQILETWGGLPAIYEARFYASSDKANL